MTEAELLQWALNQFPPDANGQRWVRLPPDAPDDQTALILPFDEQWFTNRSKGGLKIKKRGRDEWLPLLLQTLLNPDQIRTGYASDAKGKLVLRFRLFKRFELEDGQLKPILGVFDLGKDGWAGRSIHVRDKDASGNFFEGTRVLWTRK